MPNHHYQHAHSLHKTFSFFSYSPSSFVPTTTRNPVSPLVSRFESSILASRLSRLCPRLSSPLYQTPASFSSFLIVVRRAREAARGAGVTGDRVPQHPRGAWGGAATSVPWGVGNQGLHVGNLHFDAAAAGECCDILAEFRGFWTLDLKSWDLGILGELELEIEKLKTGTWKLVKI